MYIDVPLICHVGGRQFKIAPNDLIVINRIAADIGEKIYLEKVNPFTTHLLHSPFDSQVIVLASICVCSLVNLHVHVHVQL